jgi:hypothetical protein
LKERGCAVDGEAWQEVLDLDSLIRLMQKGQRKKAETVLLSKLKTYRGGIKSQEDFEKKETF